MLGFLGLEIGWEQPTLNIRDVRGTPMMLRAIRRRGHGPVLKLAPVQIP
jgi:hypothetical protein